MFIPRFLPALLSVHSLVPLSPPEVPQSPVSAGGGRPRRPSSTAYVVPHPLHLHTKSPLTAHPRHITSRPSALIHCIPRISPLPVPPLSHLRCVSLCLLMCVCVCVCVCVDREVAEVQPGGAEGGPGPASAASAGAGPASARSWPGSTRRARYVPRLRALRLDMASCVPTLLRAIGDGCACAEMLDLHFLLDPFTP